MNYRGKEKMRSVLYWIFIGMLLAIFIYRNTMN